MMVLSQVQLVNFIRQTVIGCWPGIPRMKSSTIRQSSNRNLFCPHPETRNFRNYFDSKIFVTDIRIFQVAFQVVFQVATATFCLNGFFSVQHRIFPRETLKRPVVGFYFSCFQSSVFGLARCVRFKLYYGFQPSAVLCRFNE